jgi:hypothetical protein
MDQCQDRLCGTAMASQASVKSPQGVLGKLLTLHKNKLLSQITGGPSVHHRAIGFRRKRASEIYGLTSSPPCHRCSCSGNHHQIGMVSSG